MNESLSHKYERIISTLFRMSKAKVNVCYKMIKR